MLLFPNINNIEEIDPKKLIEKLAKEIRYLYSHVDIVTKEVMTDFGMDDYTCWWTTETIQEETISPPDYIRINNLIQTIPSKIMKSVKNLSGEASEDPNVKWTI